MNALLVLAATSLLALAFCAIHGALALLDRIGPVHRFLDRHFGQPEGWE